VTRGSATPPKQSAMNEDAKAAALAAAAHAVLVRTRVDRGLPLLLEDPVAAEQVAAILRGDA
jgi:hypothetical protein